MIEIRRAAEGDFEAIWMVFSEIVGTLPRAFEHPARGLVDAHVMYRWL